VTLVMAGYVAWGLVDQVAVDPLQDRGRIIVDTAWLLTLEHFLGLETIGEWIRSVPTIPGSTAAYLILHWAMTLGVIVYLLARRPELWRRARWALAGIVAIGAAVEVLLPVAPPWMVGLAPTPSWVSAVQGHTDLVAAFPSLHVALAAWVALALGGRLWWLYPAAVGWLVITTGNHYVTDVLAGAVLAAGCWHLRAPGLRRFVPMEVTA